MPVRPRYSARTEAEALDVEESMMMVAPIPGEDDRSVAEFARVQERLMSNISHELRTPLNVVMGFAELMTTGTLGEMSANQLDAAREIYVGGQRILTIVDDILDIGRGRSYYLPDEPRRARPGEYPAPRGTLLVGQARRAEINGMDHRRTWACRRRQASTGLSPATTA